MRIQGFENDLKHAVSLGIQHISLYGLKIDEGSYFYNHKPENLPDDDIQADMYLKAIETLKDFEHYEISNFSKIGYNSRHNLNYWDNNTYYGFGCAAHGCINGTRYSNTSNLKDYIKTPTSVKTCHNLSFQEKLEEEIFLGFRKMSGINVENINKKCAPLGGVKIDNLVAEVSASGERSFRILREAPDGKSYAGDIARKYGLSFDEIINKIDLKKRS